MFKSPLILLIRTSVADDTSLSVMVTLHPSHFYGNISIAVRSELSDKVSTVAILTIYGIDI